LDKCNNKQVAWQWKVWPEPGVGMPTVFSLRVLFVLMQIAAEQKLQHGQVPKVMNFGSLSELCRRLGLAADGYHRALIKRHIGILVSTQCKSVQAFKDKNRDALTINSFKFIRDAGFSGQKDKEGTCHESNFVVWDDPVWANLNTKYVKQIDVAFMQQLRSSIAQLLYTHLSNLFHEAKDWPYAEADYTWLAERMGLKVYGPMVRIRSKNTMASWQLGGCRREIVLKRLINSALSAKGYENGF
jgi:hypothetical protein